MKKTVACLVLVLMLIVPAATTVSAASMNFSDVKTTDWYYQNIKYVVEKDIMLGFSDGTFRPTNYITRGEMFEILANIEMGVGGIIPNFYGLGVPSPYTDITRSSKYYGVALWAYYEDLTTGVGNNRFGPNDFVTREQFCLTLYRFAYHQFYGHKYPFAGILGIKSTRSISFNDVSSSNAHYAQIMACARGGIISGYEDGSFRGSTTMRRSEIASAIAMFCKNNLNMAYFSI